MAALKVSVGQGRNLSNLMSGEHSLTRCVAVLAKGSNYSPRDGKGDCKSYLLTTVTPKARLDNMTWRIGCIYSKAKRLTITRTSTIYKNHEDFFPVRRRHKN